MTRRPQYHQGIKLCLGFEITRTGSSRSNLGSSNVQDRRSLVGMGMFLSAGNMVEYGCKNKLKKQTPNETGHSVLYNNKMLYE